MSTSNISSSYSRPNQAHLSPHSFFSLPFLPITTFAPHSILFLPFSTLTSFSPQDSRGGVLEPAGAASIKFRDRDIVLTAHRVDHELISLDLKLTAAKGDEVATAVIAIQVRTLEYILHNYTCPFICPIFYYD